MKMNRDFKGVWIPAHIWLNEELSIIEKVLLVEIDSLDNDPEKGCFASNEYLAGFVKKDEGTVANIITGLRKRNYLETCFWDGRVRGLRLVKNESSLHENVKADSIDSGKQPSRKRESSLHENVNILIQDNNTSINTEGGGAPEKIPLPAHENQNAIQWGDNSEARLEKATTAVKEYFAQYPERLRALCDQARNRCNERGFWDEIGEYLRHHADNFQIMQNPIKALTSGPGNFVSWLSKPWCRDKYAESQPEQPRRREISQQPRPERERITPEQVEALREKYNVR